MSDEYYFDRKIDSRFEGEDVRLEKMGVRRYRIYTGSTEDFDFRNTMKRDRFDQAFIGELNGQLDKDEVLDLRDRDVQIALDEVRRSLGAGKMQFRFKITSRMQQ